MNEPAVWFYNDLGILPIFFLETFTNIQIKQFKMSGRFVCRDFIKLIPIKVFELMTFQPHVLTTNFPPN